MSYLVKLTTVRESFITFEDEGSAREWVEEIQKKKRENGLSLVEIDDSIISLGNELISELEILKTTPVRHVFMGNTETSKN